MYKRTIIAAVISLCLLSASQTDARLNRLYTSKPSKQFNFTSDSQGWTYSAGDNNTRVQQGKLELRVVPGTAVSLTKSFGEPVSYQYIEVRCVANAESIELAWSHDPAQGYLAGSAIRHNITDPKQFVSYEFIVPEDQSVRELRINFVGARGVVRLDSVMLSHRDVKTDIGRDIRDSVRLYPNRSYRQKIIVPANAHLFFSCGFRSENTDIDQPVEFKVVIDHDGKRTVVWSGSLPANHQAWRDTVVDLSDYAGATVTLSFECDAGSLTTSTAEDQQIYPVIGTPVIYGEPEQKPPTIIVIGIDALRADHLGCYGYGKPTSPNMDSLAKQGVLFEQAFSQSSWTLPSFTSIVTGLYPFTHNVEGERDVLSASIPAVQQIMRDNGYLSVGFTNGGYLTSWLGWDRGFDIFVQNNHFGGGNFSFSFADYKDRLFEFISKNKSCPMFLFLHTYDCHAYYDAAPKRYQDMFTSRDYPENDLKKHRFADYYLRRNADAITEADLLHIIGLYDSEIRYLDDMIGELYALLKKLDLADSTYIIITSDHGEEFDDHSSFGHNHTLYRELVHVPLIVLGPGIPAGKRISKMVETIDITPTILDFARIDISNLNFAGRSFVPLITDPHHAPFGAAISKDWNKRGIRTDAWAYFIIDNDSYLFNRHDDPCETNNLIGTEPKVSLFLEKKLDRIMQNTGSMTHKPSVGEMDEQSRKELESLGYIQ